MNIPRYSLELSLSLWQNFNVEQYSNSFLDIICPILRLCDEQMILFKRIAVNEKVVKRKYILFEKAKL